MNKEQFESIYKNYKKGTLISGEWQSITQTKTYSLVKISKGVVRMGIAYSNLKANKEKDTQGLPYGQFEINNVLIEHNGKYQVRLYPSKCKNHRTHTTYYYNGIEKTKQELIDMGVIKVKPYQERLCFNVKLENLIALG